MSLAQWLSQTGNRFNHTGANSRTRCVVLPLRRARDPRHGTTAAYARGCGCDACRAANRIVQRRKRCA